MGARGRSVPGTPGPAQGQAQPPPAPVSRTHRSLTPSVFIVTSLSFCARCDLCKYHLVSDTKKLLPLYKYHIYIIYKYPIFYFCMIVFRFLRQKLWEHIHFLFHIVRSILRLCYNLDYN